MDPADKWRTCVLYDEQAGGARVSTEGRCRRCESVKAGSDLDSERSSRRDHGRVQQKFRARGADGVAVVERVVGQRDDQALVAGAPQCAEDRLEVLHGAGAEVKAETCRGGGSGNKAGRWRPNVRTRAGAFAEEVVGVEVDGDEPRSRIRLEEVHGELELCLSRIVHVQWKVRLVEPADIVQPSRIDEASGRLTGA